MADFGLFNQQILDSTNTVAGLISNPSSIQAQFADTISLAQTEADNLKNYAQRVAGDAAAQAQGIAQGALASLDDGLIAVQQKIDTRNILGNDFAGWNNINPAAKIDLGKVSNKNEARFAPLTNVLHRYTTYTYNLSLHALDKEQYNKLVDSGNYQSKNVLISSAGRRSDSGLLRNSRWSEDFYFDKMSLESVIGINSRGRGSNVLTMDFTIVEPYGMTLLDRLAQTAEDLKWANPTEMIYLIQIDFFGYDDETLSPTSKPIEGCQRRIPVKILKVEADYNQNGSTYRISAVVVNHSGFDNETTQIHTPVRIGKVNNDRTLKALLATTDAGVSAIASTLRQHIDQGVREGRAETEKAVQGVDQTAFELGSSYQSVRATTVNTPTEIKLPALDKWGLGSILTGYWTWVGEVTGLHADGSSTSIAPYKFNFLLSDGLASTGGRKLSEAVVSEDEIINLRNKPGASKKENDQSRKGDANDVSGTSITFPLFTSIIDIINTLLKCTDYFVNQVKDEVRESTNSDDRNQQGAAIKDLQPLDFFKISPVVTYGPYIQEKRDYQKIITFVILPYKYYGNRLPFGGKGNPKKSDCLKEYNYLFTGQNTDILDLKIDFNNTFYSFITVNAGHQNLQVNRAAAQGEVPGQGKEVNKPENAEGYKYSILGGKVLAAPITGVITDQNKSSESTVRVNDLFNNIYSASKADMLAVDMKILGDPSYIQEEECSYSAIYSSSLGNRANGGKTLKSGSLVYNDGDILVKLNFKFKNDIDTSPTGLGNFTDANKDAGIKARFFTGIYKVMTVRSDFERGVFTQQLNMVRLYNDEEAKSQTLQNPRDTRSSMDQHTDLQELEHAAEQVGLSNTNGPVDPFGGFNQLKVLDTVPQKVITSVTSSVNTTVQSLSNQATDKVKEFTKELAVRSQPVVSLDGVETFGGLPGAGVVNSVEANRILQEFTRNIGDIRT